MDVEITPRAGYLRIAVSERHGSHDARRLLEAIIQAVQEGEHRKLLVSVRRSQAIFKVEDYGLYDALARAAGVPGLKVALVADTSELYASYQYVELLAAQKQLATKAFRSEADAVRWLLAP
jgi:hypothetical protein